MAILPRGPQRWGTRAHAADGRHAACFPVGHGCLCAVDELVVVADTSLAGLSGLDVPTVLRAAGRRTVVVLVAAPDDVAAGREAGALGAVVIDRDGDAAAAARAAARTRAALDLQARRGHARAPARA